MKVEKRKSIVDNIVKLIIVILMTFITYVQYFLVIPNTKSIADNKKQIYELRLKVEEYQVTNSIIFKNIINRLDGL